MTSESQTSARPVASDRAIYPFSLVPGGVRDGAEVAIIRAADPVVRNHYSGLGANLTRQAVPRDRWLYTSYRVGTSVYWTKHTVRVRAGETVLSDGINMIRGRCGNRLSSVPNTPTRLIDPPSILEDTPTVVTEDKPPDFPFGDPGDPVEIPVDLPGQPATPGSHRVPTVPGVPKPEITITTRQPIMVPGAPLFTPRSTAAAVEAPEPGTWAMMLGGLAFIGFGAHRTRKAARS